jgi:hypothetical protein
MPLLQIIHVTAAYSNAVLVAVLPHVTDFSKKLDLPIALPITANQVSRFNVDPIQGHVGGGLWLTNGYHFIFQGGIVDTFDVLTNNPWKSEDPANDWPHYIGKINMTTNDAIELAQDALKKLGYDPKELHADVSNLRIEGPYELRQGHFPYCQIKWNESMTTDEERTNSAYVKAQINLEAKSLLGLTIIGRKVWKPEPKIDVVPETEANYRKRVDSPPLKAVEQH